MIKLLYLTLLIVTVTIVYGIISLKKNKENSEKKIKKAFAINLSAFIPVIGAAIIIVIMEILFPTSAAAATDAAASAASESSGLGYIAAALSTGLATIGAGYAVGTVGSSALGAVSEDPKILGKTLIYVGLAEGIAIYGLIVSIMILAKL